jgi:hypothetical protein
MRISKRASSSCQVLEQLECVFGSGAGALELLGSFLQSSKERLVLRERLARIEVPIAPEHRPRRKSHGGRQSTVGADEL